MPKCVQRAAFWSLPAPCLCARMMIELPTFHMKRIFYTCLAAFAAAYTAPAAEDAASAAPAGDTPAAAAPSAEEQEKAPATEESADLSEEEVIASYRKRLEESDKEYATLKRPTKAMTSRYERHVADVNEHLKKMEDYRKVIEESEAKQKSILEQEYVFSIVPVEERTKYETEGSAELKKTIDLFSSKDDASQIRGLRAFEKQKETHQGLPAFKEAHSLYVKLIAKFEKKWNKALEAAKLSRDRMPGSRKDRLKEEEESRYESFARKMEAEGYNIEEEWFMPKMQNAVMLEKALGHVVRAKATVDRRLSNEDTGKVPEALNQFWKTMDEARDMMMQGKMDEAIAKISDDENYRYLLSLNRYLLPEELKDAIRKQSDDFRGEVRRRQSELRNVEREAGRAVSAFEREKSYLDTRMSSISESIAQDKDEEIRRAEEAAAREAELKAEQEREAQEAAEEEDDEDAAKKPKKKKKGSKKKAKAEEKPAEAAEAGATEES